MEIVASKIIAKDAAMKAGIESKKATILMANEAWNVATVAAANTHISATNATRAADAAQESEICALAKVNLQGKIDDIVDNDLPGANSVGEADRVLADHMVEFNAALATSATSLQADRDEFSTNVGELSSFVLSLIAAYDPVGIE